MKSFCNIHKFYYENSYCPWCECDRISSLTKKYYKHNKPVVNEQSTPENQQDKSMDELLEALQQKFNKH